MKKSLLEFEWDPKKASSSLRKHGVHSKKQLLCSVMQMRLHMRIRITQQARSDA